ncbi:TPA: tail fiber assembly protein [Escherichia coli]|nr:tail fiber assembly protein [Escherichia coli]HCO1860703.1 tail fiber assembly protein [Escherichia coli]
MNYAVIENGVVTNIAVWDGESAWQPTNALVIPVSDNVRIGWFYDKGKLSSPTQPPKKHDELLREAENERQCLLDSANGLIMNWQSDLLLGIISENNKNNLLLWKEYVNNLMSVDLSLIPEITWPERPEIIR